MGHSLSFPAPRGLYTPENAVSGGDTPPPMSLKQGKSERMPDLKLNFDQSGGNQLDDFALLARQDYNLGKKNDWFGHFRGGLYGHYSRLSGASIHYENIHRWLPVPQLQLCEYNLASFFFNAASALECLVYALNALGYAADPALFCDITKASKLKKIAPRNIVGDNRNKPLAGYKKYFPLVQREWTRSEALLKKIVDLHEVSKHRTTIYTGGMARSDPPPGFFERLGITDKSTQALFAPAKEVILKFDPKLEGKQLPLRREDYEKLEDIAPSYCEFINKILKLAAKDAKATIKLKEKKLRA